MSGVEMGVEHNMCLMWPNQLEGKGIYSEYFF